MSFSHSQRFKNRSVLFSFGKTMHFRGIKTTEVKLVKPDFRLLLHTTKWKYLLNINIISFLQNKFAVA